MATLSDLEGKLESLDAQIDDVEGGTIRVSGAGFIVGSKADTVRAFNAVLALKASDIRRAVVNKLRRRKAEIIGEIRDKIHGYIGEEG